MGASWLDPRPAPSSLRPSEPAELILLNGLSLTCAKRPANLHLFGLWNMGDRMARGLRLRPNAYRTPQAKCLSARRPLWRRCVCFRRLVASLLRGSKPVYAQPIASDVPEVDRVSVRVVTDSYQFAVAVGKTGSVDRRRNEEVGRRHEQSGA